MSTNTSTNAGATAARHSTLLSTVGASATAPRPTGLFGQPSSTIFASATTPITTNVRPKSRATSSHSKRSPNQDFINLPSDHDASARLRRNLSSAPDFGITSFTVLVGPAESATRFSLHKNLAITKSGFFESSFRNDWKESSENVVNLPDHEPEHFQIFFLWLYCNRIFSITNLFSSSESSHEWELLAHAWALGAYLQATDFQDAVTDAILEKSTHGFTPLYSIHKTIYANTIIGAPIRKLVVDIAVWRWDSAMLEAQGNNAAWSDFFRDLSIALLKSRSTTDESKRIRPSCEYHEHRVKGTACYTTKQHGFF